MAVYQSERGTITRFSRGRYARWVELAVISSLLLAAVMVFSRDLQRTAWADESWVVQLALNDDFMSAWAEAGRRDLPIAPGYLWVQHRLVRLEWLPVYRLPSLLAATLLGAMTFFLCRRWSGSTLQGVAGVALLLACPILRRYATEIKQYLPDATISLGVILLADVWLRTGKRAFAWWWFLLCAGALWLTFAGWFAVVATAVLTVSVWMWRRQFAQMVRAVLLSALLGTMAMGIYLVFLQNLSTSNHLHHWWSAYFLTFDRAVGMDIWEKTSGLIRQSWYLYDLPIPLLLATSGIGWVLWLRAQPWTAIGVALTVILTMSASAAGLWPMGLRVNLTLVAFLHLCMLAAPLLGWPLVVRMLPGTSRSSAAWWAPLRLIYRAETIGLLAAIAFLGLTLRDHAQTDPNIAAIDRLLARLAQITQPGDVVLMDSPTALNQKFHPHPIRGTCLPGPDSWENDMADKYQQLISLTDTPVLLITDGHHNRTEPWHRLERVLEPHTSLDLIWSDRLAAIYKVRRNSVSAAAFP